MSIRRYFDELKLRLMIDPSVELFEVISEKIEEKEGYLRVVIKLSDDSVMQSQMTTDSAPDREDQGP